MNEADREKIKKMAERDRNDAWEYFVQNYIKTAASILEIKLPKDKEITRPAMKPLRVRFTKPK